MQLTIPYHLLLNLQKPYAVHCLLPQLSHNFKQFVLANVMKPTYWREIIDVCALPEYF